MTADPKPDATPIDLVEKLLSDEPMTRTEAAAEITRLRAELAEARDNKNQAYEERNRLVSLLASMFSGGIAKTDIEGWDPEWHQCVYIDFPWGQASWHFHDSQAHLFQHLPPYRGSWDGHTTEGKYDAIQKAAIEARALFKPAHAVDFAAGIEAAAKYHDNFLMTKTSVAVEKVVASTEAIRALTPPDITAAAARVLLAAWPTDTSFDAAFAACATAYHGGDQMQDTMDRTLATVSAALRALAEVKP